jgi:lipoprotein NlpI/outer membrane protein assembly factor BamB
MRALAVLALGLALLCSAQQPVEQLLTAAMTAYREGRSGQAFTLASQAIAKAPDDPTGYFIRGTVYESRRQHDRARADYDRVVELSPSLALAYSRRGALRFKMADFSGAVEDFDREIALDAAKGNNHWQRGIALYYAGRSSDCWRQFELSYRTVNPHDYENGIFQFLCRAREEGVEKARKSMLKIEGDKRAPMQEIYALYQGKGSAEDVFRAAEAGATTAAEIGDRLFYAHLYVGLFDAVKGDPGLARAHVERAYQNFPVAHFMWDVARVQAGLPAEAPAAEPPAVSQAQDKPKAFRDPNPPKVREPSGKAAPAPHKRSGVTFHAPPKPLAPNAVTDAWTSFLGPTHNAVSTETKLLAELPEGGPPLVWEMEKGVSYTSPAIQGDRLVYLHRVGDRERVECLHPETGELYWQDEYPTDFQDRYGYNNGPRASPVIDGGRVYTYGALGKLQCRELATGELLWSRDIPRDFKVPQDFFGLAATPLIEGDLLIVSVGAPGGPTVAGLDKRTGAMVWGAGQEWGAGYGSPIPATVRGERRVFVLAGGESRPPAGGLLSIDPANGQIDFTFAWRSRDYESVNASSPVALGDRVFVSAAYQTGGALLEMPAAGRHSVAWVNPTFDLHFTTAVEHEGHLYGFTGRNEGDAALACVRLDTGKQMWRNVLEWNETVQANGRSQEITESPLRGSLLKVDGRFLAIGEHGHLLWLHLSPNGPTILSRASLFKARETWAPPVLSRGLLYISQNTRGSYDKSPPRLLCYDLRQPGDR